MVVPRYSAGALISRFLTKKFIVFVLAMAGLAVFYKNPLTYGYPWLLAMFILWCLLDVAGLYGEVRAYGDLRQALAAGQDPHPLVEIWLRRDTRLEKIDGLVLALVGAVLFVLGYPKWIASLALLFGLLKFVPFMAEADPRDVNRMTTNILPAGYKP